MTGDVTYDFCFGTCSLDGSCPIANTANVTFRLNLNEYSGEVGLVSIAGDFNGWGAGVDILTDDDNDGVYSTTLMLEEGSRHFKFVMDEWGDYEEFDGSETCTTNVGDHVRTVEISEDEVFTFCWESCENCTMGCTIPSACNYHPWATEDNGSCEFISCLSGCTDEAACNCGDGCC